MITPDKIPNIEADLARVGSSAPLMCQRAGVAYSTWWRWKTDSGSPNYATLKKLTAAYDAILAEKRTAAE